MKEQCPKWESFLVLSLLLGTLAATGLARGQQPVPRRPRLQKPPPPAYIKHDVVTFRLTPQRTTFFHTFTTRRSGPVTIEIRWRPKDIRIQSLIFSAQARGKAVNASAWAPNPGHQYVWFQTPGGPSAKWLLKLSYQPLSPQVSVDGKFAIVEGVLPRRKRPRPPAERLRIALEQMKGENPFWAVFMHTLQRYVHGVPAGQQSALDRALSRAIQARPGIETSRLRQFLADYQALPQTLRMKVTPPALRNLAVEKRLDLRTLKNVFSIPPVPVPKTLTMQPAHRPTIPARMLAPGFRGHAQFIAWLTYLANPPHIDALQHKKPLYPGDIVDIRGKNFTPGLKKNRVHILMDYFGERALLATLYARPATQKALRIRIPKSIDPGHYYIQVESWRKLGWRKSNVIDLHVTKRPPPPPVITQILPVKGQYPGKSIRIQAKNIDTSGKWKQFVEIESMATGEIRDFTGKKIQITTNEIALNLPRNLLPGKYYIRVWQAGTPSRSKIYTVKPYRFQLRFTEIACFDETNPEWWGSDEILTVWGIVADGKMWLKTSQVYEGFDGGERKNFKSADRVVFPMKGNNKAVQAALAMRVKLYEWDAGDAKAVEKYMGMVGDVANVIAEGFGAGELGYLLDKTLEALGALIAWLGGDPDSLGRKDLSWTVFDLQKKVYYIPLPLTFKGKDYQYVLYFDLQRYPE